MPMSRSDSSSTVPRVALVAIVLLVGTLLRAQQQPTFRTGTRTVPVFVTVLDAAGRLVTDLVRDDFEILDNGTLQDITVFENKIQPITLVLLLDRSNSMALNFRLEREAAEQLVGDLMAADKAKIGSFSRDIEIDPEHFTSSHDELLEVINMDLLGAGPTPLWSAIDAGMDALKGQDGRRVVLVFTDGSDEPGDFRGRIRSLTDVMNRARVDDVMVYAVGLTGYWGPGSGGGGMGLRGGGRGMELPDKGLKVIAGESGGGYFELKSADNLATTFKRVAEELHHQYALGFVPEVLDGKTHKVEVRVKREGMAARARKSYVASKADKK
jgi:Ca-activated chloride channel family protein